MPQCSDLGVGYSGEWPACTYSHDPEEIDLTRLPEHPSGEDWSMYFDAYDPTKQEMAERDAGIDIGQLQDVWSLQSGQLGEAWGLKRGELGWGAGLGLKEARRTGIGAKRKSGMAFSGTAEEMQRLAESNVMGSYERGLKAGKTAYEQALATGELGLTQGITDIYQQLGQDIYGYVEDWEDYQRDTRNMLYGSGLDWSNEEEQTTFTCEQQGMQTCPDGTCAPWDSTCAGQGEDENPCSLGQTQCPDGTCVWGGDSPGDPCANHGSGSGSNCEPGSCTETGCGVTCDPFVETWNSSSCTCES